MIQVLGSLLLLGAAAFAGHGYWRLRRGVGSRHRATSFLDALVRYEERDDRPGAVRICDSVPRLGLSTKLALHLLGLEIPGRVLPGLSSTYRTEARSPAFDSVLDEEIESLVGDLRQHIHGLALRSILGAVVLTVISGLVLLLGLRPLGIIGGLLGALSLVDSTLQWRWVLTTVDQTPPKLRRWIVPTEEMSRAQREGAAAARRILSESSRRKAPKRR